VVRGVPLHRRADGGSFWGGRGRASHVRAAAVLCLPARPLRPGPDVQRIRGDIRSPRRHLGMRAVARGRGALRGGRVYHRRLLVHGLDLVCESRGAPAGRRAAPGRGGAEPVTVGTLSTRLATLADAASIAAIYSEGIADRIATFETEP